MTAGTKTNAARLLEARGIPYRVRVYDAGGAFHSADEAADLLGVPGASVLKTLVILRETTGRAKPLLVLVPSDRQVDLKRLGQAIGEKRLRMASQREAERLTGLKVGGISALAVRAGAFEVLVDASAAVLGSGPRERGRSRRGSRARGGRPPRRYRRPPGRRVEGVAAATCLDMWSTCI